MEENKIILDSQCLNCKNWIIGNKCLAYLKGIPKQFLFNEKKHTKIVKGQYGKFKFEER